jgi:Na+/glutamate symporter
MQLTAKNLQMQKILQVSMTIVVIFVFVYFERFYLNNYRADVHYEAVNRDLAQANLATAMEHADKAIDLS